MKFAEFNRKSNSLGVLFFLPFPLAPHPPKWITGQLLREGQYSPAGPSRYGNAESFPRVFSATILTMETTLFIIQNLRWKDTWSPWSKFTDHLLPRLSKEIVPSARVEKQKSLAATGQPPLNWALLVLVACVITRHWVQVIPIHVTACQSVLRPQRREQEEETDV